MGGCSVVWCSWYKGGASSKKIVCQTCVLVLVESVLWKSVTLTS